MNTIEILTAQRDIADKLETSRINIKKTKCDLRTLKNKHSRETQVNDLWLKYVENHKSLTEHLPVDHDYFKNDLYALTKEIVDDTFVILSKWELQKENEEKKEGGIMDIIGTTTSATPTTAS